MPDRSPGEGRGSVMQAGNIPGDRAFAKPDSGLRRETGDFAALLLMLAASASCIAVPAVMRVAMPRGQSRRKAESLRYCVQQRDGLLTQLILHFCSCLLVR